jgi:hypothetical protein
MKKLLQKNEKPFDELLNDFVEGETKDEERNTKDEDEDDWEWDDYPDGEVELNDHAKIQLRILHPEPHPRQALERLEGCADIKARIDELVALTAFNRKLTRLMPGAKPHAVSLHSVFLGNPGTGKTTVCKIFGALLREAGALSLGHVVVCDRGSFIGTLWGDTERAVEGIVEQARGGVLMIDRSRAPSNENWSVRGIGVAVSVKVSTFDFKYRRRAFAATPNFCSSSMISNPKSLNSNVFPRILWVPITMSSVPFASHSRMDLTSEAVRSRLT